MQLINRFITWATAPQGEVSTPPYIRGLALFALSLSLWSIGFSMIAFAVWGISFAF